MPEADVTRKRSRSPSESENKQHKRPNTGAADNSESLARARDDASVKREDDGTTGASTTSSPSHAATGGEGGDGSVSVGAEATISGSATGTPMANIHMRCLIVTQDASIIIGKGGAHVNEIREKSGAKVMVTESIPGNPERILNVHGPLDAVSKVCTCHYRTHYHVSFFCRRSA
jgi:heterogeneous nuclear rnp K-like protein